MLQDNAMQKWKKKATHIEGKNASGNKMVPDQCITELFFSDIVLVLLLFRVMHIIIYL